MKKRTVISIIITIICIILTNKFWFNIKPLQIAFNAKGSGNTKFEFYLNKKDNDDFKKVKYGVVEADLNDTENIELFINRVHKAQKVKITITSPKQKNLILSKISLRYDKYKLDDLDAFSAENATLKINGNKLIIFPKAESFSIIYNKPVNIKSATKIDIKILIVIAVLTFLLSYKLTSYLADFKILNNASRLDIIFLLMFFVLLFIPMSNIDTQTTRSNKENRNLAKYKPFINNNQINFNFGNDFNYWYNDRFYGRKKIIYFYNQARYRIAIYFYNKNGVSINKKNKWFNHTETMKPAPLKITNEELESYASSVNNIKKFCDKNNIKLYIILIPNKSIIYKKESYPFIGISKEEKYSEQVQKYIYQKTRVKILYPIKELETEKKTIMYITKQIITGHFLEDMSDINI